MIELTERFGDEIGLLIYQVLQTLESVFEHAQHRGFFGKQSAKQQDDLAYLRRVVCEIVGLKEAAT